MPSARFGSVRFRVRRPKTTKGGNRASIRAGFWAMRLWGFESQTVLDAVRALR